MLQNSDAAVTLINDINTKKKYVYIYIYHKTGKNLYYICPFTKYLNYYEHSSVNCLHSDFPNFIIQPLHSFNYYVYQWL